MPTGSISHGTLVLTTKTVALSAMVTLGLVVGRAHVDAAGYSNGYLPQSALSRIHHPTYALYLRHDAAGAWNAMRAYTRARGQDIYPLGRISAYRTYAQQVEAKRLYGSNAATPGTSNHGWGLAVDLASTSMRSAIDRHGEQFGWAKKWSDASWEWWHLKYRDGIYRGGNPGANSGTSSNPSAILSVGSRGPGVTRLQRALERKGFDPGPIDGIFGTRTREAVVRFQRSRGLTVDGIVGPRTRGALGI